MALSLTQQLCLSPNSFDDSILFYHHPSTLTSNIDVDGKQLHQQQPNSDSDDERQYLTYKQCWKIVAEHQQWLEANIIRQQRSIILEDSEAATDADADADAADADAYANASPHLTTTANTTRIRDVVIGYLADNSPDLLLSVLACIKMTTAVSIDKSSASSYASSSSSSSAAAAATALGISEILQGAKVLPAMINSRWTPSEMERALRPTRHYAASDSETKDVGGSKDNIHVTIVLYGLGYERTAEQAVRRMNQPKTTQQQNIHSDGDHGDQGGCATHVAVALPLPDLTDRCATESVNLNFSSAIRNDVPAKSIKQDSTNTTDQKSIARDDDNDASTSDDDALLLFTSGTSSPNGAKGVRLSHRSLLVQARAKTRRPCLYDDRTNAVATTVPWFHVGGMSSALAVMLAGGSLVFPASDEGSGGAAASKGGVRKAFRPGMVLDSIRSNENSASLSVAAANTLVVVPAMLHAIAEHVRERFSTMIFPNVRLILVGGQSIGNGRLYDETRRLFPKARIVQTYACTEAGSSITFEDLGWGIEIDGDNDGCREPSDGGTSQNDGLDGATCVGCPPPHIQIGIFNAEAPLENIARPPSLLPHGTMGIIGTRGPHVMSGYWNRRGDTPPTTNPSDDGDWMLTNDLGYIHPRSGKLFFCGRANDVIRTGGESVLATEVERVIETHADITECAVFALPDEKFGEAVCAAVVLEGRSTGKPAQDGNTMEEGRWVKWVRKHCAEHQLAGFKRPRRVFCVNALPRNSSGKVLKHVIIRLCASQSKEASRL